MSETDTTAEGPTYSVRLKDRYRNEILLALKESQGYANVNQVPRITKIVLNMGLGEAIQNQKVLDGAVEQLTAITGQKAVVTRARRSVSNFKLREGMPIGARVTLRGARMYEFLDRLVNVALPRQKDFKGISAKAFDGRGNYTLGIVEQIIFPEIDYDQVEKVRGMNCTIVTTAKTDDEARSLLREFGMPFRGAQPRAGGN